MFDSVPLTYTIKNPPTNPWVYVGSTHTQPSSKIHTFSLSFMAQIIFDRKDKRYNIHPYFLCYSPKYHIKPYLTLPLPQKKVQENKDWVVGTHKMTFLTPTYTLENIYIHKIATAAC